MCGCVFLIRKQVVAELLRPDLHQAIQVVFVEKNNQKAGCIPEQSRFAV